MRPLEAYFLGLLALLWIGAGPVAAAERVDDTHIVKPTTDSREYRYRRFDNGFQLLLVHEPEAEHWHLAVDVAAGYGQEPPHPAGTATLLAYSLLQAREALQPLLEQGRVDTRVTAGHSRFTLSLPASDSGLPALAGVMDALLQPAFDEPTLSRALAHMDSDFQRALTSDWQRRRDVYCALYRPTHPLARHCRAAARVEQLGAEALPTPLEAYYNRQYVPAQTAWVVSSPLPLDKLDALVSPRLREVPVVAAPPATDSEPLMAEDTLPVAVDIRSTDSAPRLFLSFAVPHEAEHQIYQPYSLATALLENDGPGGLLWLLQDLGWAQSLRAGLRPLSRDYQLYDIELELTDLGVRARDQVVALIFYQLGQIRDRGLEVWRYNELAQLAELDFRFNRTPGGDLGQLAERLHRVSPEHLLFEPYQFAPFDAELHARYLSHLTSDNVIVAYTGSDVSAEALSPMLAAPYTRSSLAAEQPDIKISVRRKLSFPGENAFIPKRLNVKDEQLLPTPGARMEPASGPVKIEEKPRFHAWYQQDVHFRVPRSSVYVRIDSPATVTGASAAVSTHLFATLLERQLHASVHQARAAGFDFSLRPQPQGLAIELSGYSSQQGLMLTRMGQVLNDARFSEAAFERAQRQLQKTLQSRVGQVEAQIENIHIRPHWSVAEQLAALESLTFGEFTRFAGQFFDGAFIRSFYFGNLYRQEAQRLAALTEHYLSSPGSRALPRRQLTLIATDDQSEKPRRLSLAAETSPPEVHLYVQGTGTDASSQAQMALLRTWLPQRWTQALPDTDDSLQLTVKPLDLLGYPGALVSLSALRTDTDTLAQLLRELLASDWPEDDWRPQARALIAHWRHPPATQREQGLRLWHLIDRHGADFDFYRERIRALETLDEETLHATYRKTFAWPRGVWLLTPDTELDTLGSSELERYREGLPVYSSP